jgi:proline iminopeptidase
MSDALFPLLEPYASGWLPVGDDHRIWYEECGNPNGTPVLFLHGGPGSSINANHRRFFDPAFYRIVLFDQRGCGRSTPLGETRSNTTQHLVADIERLRQALGIERWMMFGGSWGSTLALAYAQTNSGAVAGLILRGVFLASTDEVEWFLTGLHRFLPEAWTRFAAGAEDLTAAGLLRFYSERIAANDEMAARRWTAWESAVMSVGEATATSTQADSSALARVRIQVHYLVNACFLAPDQLFEGLKHLDGLPAIIVQGRRDLVCPPATAYTLAERWPGAQLRMVEEGGHSAMHPAVAQALVQATQDMKERLTAP